MLLAWPHANVFSLIHLLCRVVGADIDICISQVMGSFWLASAKCSVSEILLCDAWQLATGKLLGSEGVQLLPDPSVDCCLVGVDTDGNAIPWMCRPM